MRRYTRASEHLKRKQAVTLGIDGAPDAAPDDTHETLNLLRSDEERQTVTVALETESLPVAGDPNPAHSRPSETAASGTAAVRCRKVMLYHLFSR